ncbi:hypothetical protein B5M42_017825 [Paenibacillus athensensis]|uniref:Uncharacterized protein n=1 Tax=Paenibacillus athensensis TaxID=1967502 RepID=A0A4Y8Q195_9BACL|nr:hypothetical protein [Paenibacillus athensensis]MCD1260663.1 hypothetical protein [Paenibacillus athensensis]
MENGARADGKPISDSDIPQLIELSKRKAIEKESNSTNPKFHSTKQEQESKFHFSQKYNREVSFYNDAIYLETSRTKKLKNNQEKLEQCRKAVQIYDEFKSFCYSKGLYGQLYFDNMWEHCHNSKQECYKFYPGNKEATGSA